MSENEEPSSRFRWYVIGSGWFTKVSKKTKTLKMVGVVPVLRVCGGVGVIIRWGYALIAELILRVSWVPNAMENIEK